jgi:two-component system, LytTR family, response regulator
MKLKCIAVDDESMARKLLEENIGQIPFLDLVKTCKNAFEAMQVLQEEHIDLMFLDIQMPGMLGTKFLASLREKPMVIFVTAYSSYAVESYDLEVVDYLMKPVSLERFTKAAYKALEVWKSRQSPASREA